MRHLATFSGGFTLPAAAAVAGDVDGIEPHIADGIASLVYKSLVTPDRSAATPRWYLDESERATAELAEARRLSGDDRYSSLARLKALANFGVPKIRALYEATYFAGLRKAGVPEE